ncbi:MAG: cobalt-zinc-cadmium efflux system outer membrane protein [Flavobacteriales bacterium]|jgi:cobalt-zinc-cadmium efflux system outer membrane protein
MKNRIAICFSILGFVFTVEAQSLKGYQLEAVENNQGLKAQYKRFEAGLQKASQMSSLPDPNLSFAYFVSPIETRVGPQQARISLSQMFPWFGTLSVQNDIWTLKAEADFQKFINAKNELYYRVSEAYYPLWELNKRRGIQRENILLLESYKAIATSKFENGQSPLVDVLRVDIILAEAKTKLEILEDRILALERNFNLLLNRDAGKAIGIDSLIIPQVSESLSLDKSLSDHPLIQAMDLQLAASEATITLAAKQGLPKIGLGLDYALIGERTDMKVVNNGRDAIMPMVNLSLPIFRGKYKAAKKEAVLMQESMTLQKQELQNNLLSSLEFTTYKISKSKKEIQLYTLQSERTQQSLNLLLKSYANSGKGFDETVRMLQKLLQYKEMKSTAMKGFYTALAEMEYITAKNDLK